MGWDQRQTLSTGAGDFSAPEDPPDAEKHNGHFATDDNGAHEFVRRHPSLGMGRVIDSIHILRSAVADGVLSAANACDVANAIEDAGRSFRPTHRHVRGPDYFDH